MLMPNHTLWLIVRTVINAALSAQTITSSLIFDLAKTYFLLTGIAGVNPKQGTVGAVAFAKYCIQVDTQLEYDSREIPETWPSGYIPMGAETPDSYPHVLHGSEIFELNGDLRQIALSLARTATLEDSDAARELRSKYSNSPSNKYHAATLPPSILEGDVSSSNVFFHGNLLCEAMEKAMKIYTTDKAEYVMTAMEDSAIITALMRAALQEKVDFSRIMLTRAGCNFDRSHLDHECPTLPFIMDEGGLKPAVRNLYLSGIQIVREILDGWSDQFENGVKATNYIGDVYGSLGGTPDFVSRNKSSNS